MFQIRSKEENGPEIMSKSKICKYNPAPRHHVLKKSDLKLQNLEENLFITPYKQSRLSKSLTLKRRRKRFLKSKLLLIELAIFAVTEAGK